MPQNPLVNEVLVLLKCSYFSELLLLLSASDLSDVPHLHRLKYFLSLLSFLVVGFVDVANV